MMTAEQLKASILQMAMQGKLVEQRAEEGTAQELYEEIQNQIQQAIKEGRLKKRKKLTFLSEQDIPFDIPDTWKWVQLRDVTQMEAGGTPSRTQSCYWNGDIPWVKIGDMNGKFTSQTSEYITQDGLKRSTAKLFPKGTVLYSIFASIGTVSILTIDAATNQAIVGISHSKEIDTDYLYYVLTSLKSVVIKKQHGMAQMNINQTILNEAPFPLPPLEEQKRIAAKIEELMPFVEQYAKASTRLNTLNASFPDQMKKSILQQAVMGKLVPQDPNDEPASVLLKKIAEEKQKLIKEGKIKKQKALPAITEDEIPFDIPESWEWVQLDELAIFENGDRGKNYPNKSEYVQSGVAWINTSHIKPNGYLTTTEMNYITREKFETLRSGKIEENDLVFCLRGATYGKVSRVEPYTEGAVASSLMIIRPIISILRDYLLLYLKTPLAFSELAKYANGSAQPNLGAKDVRKYLVPLPPLKEQKRILECVEEILPKLDDLRK